MASLAKAIESHASRIGHTRIAVSEFTARRLPVGPRTVVIPNGVDFRSHDLAEES